MLLSSGKRTKQTRYVISIDEEPGRVLLDCDAKYIDSEECDAFNGFVEAICYPDGEIEYF